MHEEDATQSTTKSEKEEQQKNPENGHHSNLVNSSSSTNRNSSRVHPLAKADECSAKSANWHSPAVTAISHSGDSTQLSSPVSSESSEQKQPKESRTAFLLQTCIPFVLAGCGLLGTGVLLEKASKWLFLSSVPEALILVPALLGLKGNLEMTLASRLSTMVHLGELKTRHQRWVAFYSNVCLVQAQAIVVSLAASLFVVCINQAEGNEFHFSHAFSIVLSSTVAASMASFVLASMMVFIAIVAQNCNVNPDNISTPLAAALGDLISLSFLLFFGTLFYQMRDTYMPLLLVIACILLCTVPLWVWAAAREPKTRHLLKYGWFAILAAMFISSGGGIVLRFAIRNFPDIALFQPVINGFGGNLVAVQASKISTLLHQFGKKGELPANRLCTYANPFRTFSCKERESRNALILLIMSVPGHLIFYIILTSINQEFNFVFLGFYLVAAVLQEANLMYICQLLCRFLWRFSWNPDDNAIPLLTALGDLLGTSLLYLAFFLHNRFFPDDGAWTTTTVTPNDVAGNWTTAATFLFPADEWNATATSIIH